MARRGVPPEVGRPTGGGRAVSRRYQAWTAATLYGLYSSLPPLASLIQSMLGFTMRSQASHLRNAACANRRSVDALASSVRLTLMQPPECTGGANRRGSSPIRYSCPYSSASSLSHSPAASAGSLASGSPPTSPPPRASACPARPPITTTRRAPRRPAGRTPTAPALSGCYPSWEHRPDPLSPMPSTSYWPSTRCTAWRHPPAGCGSISTPRCGIRAGLCCRHSSGGGSRPTSRHPGASSGRVALAARRTGLAAGAPLFLWWLGEVA